MTRRTLQLGVVALALTSPIVGHEAEPNAGPNAPSVRGRIERKAMTVTAYCPCKKCCGESASGTCANGMKVWYARHFVAAPAEIPFDSQVSVPGYNDGKLVRVWDRGGAIDGDRIDVFFASHDEALKWGVREATVTIYYKDE